MAEIRMDWRKILRARHRIRSGFYHDPEIRSALLDRCVESILREAASDEGAAGGSPDHGCSALAVTL